MVTKAWIILLVDRADLHRPQGCVSRHGRRTRQLRRAMLFGSKRKANNFVRKRPREFWRVPCPWNARWLPVVVPVQIDTGESVMAALDVHSELR